MTRITLCLIARDEERMLPGCLESVRGVLDEIVVVDTGSKDRTAAIARAAGAKVVPFTWCDDFAAARNAAFPHATGDWIIVLDADERLAPGAGAALRRAVLGARFDVAMLPLHNAARLDADVGDVLAGRARIGPAMRVPRLLRRTPHLAYRGAIHENVTDWVAARGSRVEPVDAAIVHFGAVPSERERLRKRERNVGLLRAACARDPDDQRAAAYLALELWEAGDCDGAEVIAEAAWRRIGREPRHRSIHRLAVVRALVAVRRGLLDRVLETVKTAQARDGVHPDLAYLCGAALENAALAQPVGDARRLAYARAAAEAYAAALDAARTPPLEHLLVEPFGAEGRARLAAARALADEPSAAPARISLCMIVRDEEAMLPGCLESVRGVVDEIVLVDTGSSDRTVEIARAAGALVVPFDWCDDFAAARNEAQRHATGDFALVLDADERLAPGAKGPLRAAVARGGWDAAVLAKHDAVRPDAPLSEVLSGRARMGQPVLEVKLHRLAAGARWSGCIHESLGAWIAERGRPLLRVDAAIVHLGNAASIRRDRRKNERNLLLLRRRLAADPADPMTYGYLATELLEAGDLAGAASIAEEGWRVARDPRRNVRRLAAARALTALARGDAARALATADELLAREGPSADGLFLRGCALEELALSGRGSATEAARAFREALARERHPDTDRVVAGASGATLFARLGEAELLAGRPVDARDAFEAALAREPAHLLARLGLVEAVLDCGDAPGALAAVERHLDEGPDGWAIAALCAGAVGAAAELAVFSRRAVERAPRGYVSPRRRARLAAAGG